MGRIEDPGNHKIPGSKARDKAAKAALRAAALRVRDAVSPEVKCAADREIFRLVTALPEYASARLLLCYVSVRSEPDTVRLIEQALRGGKTVAVPRCGEDGTMAFYAVRTLAGLRAGRFGIPEPPPEIRVPVDPRGGLCIVPGLRFDAHGNRLGYGKGFYDRFLAERPGIAAGICYDRLFSEQPLPCEPHDTAVGIVVTERRIVRIGAGIKFAGPSLKRKD